MKLVNVIRIYRHSYFGDEIFYTILMDYNPWKICYSCESIMHQDYMDSKSLDNIKESVLLEHHNAVSEIDSWIENFFREEDVLKWRRAEDLIPENEMDFVLDGATFGLIWKKDNFLKEIAYQQGRYPDTIPFPEYKRLQDLINHLDKLRMKY